MSNARIKYTERGERAAYKIVSSLYSWDTRMKRCGLNKEYTPCHGRKSNLVCEHESGQGRRDKAQSTFVSKRIVPSPVQRRSCLQIGQLSTFQPNFGEIHSNGYCS